MKTLRDIISDPADMEQLFCDLITSRIKGQDVPQRLLKEDQAKVELSACTDKVRNFSLCVTPAEYITILTFACAYMNEDGELECRFGSYKIRPVISVEI